MRQTLASLSGLSQSYDGRRGRATDHGETTHYLRSSVLGGQVVGELGATGQFKRGYVYLGLQMLAIQQSPSTVRWVHQDPVTKSQRVTDSAGTVVAAVDMDPWGGETNRSYNSSLQPRKYTTYERDHHGADEAMMRKYDGRLMRFREADPYDGSYDLSDSQRFD